MDKLDLDNSSGRKKIISETVIYQHAMWGSPHVSIRMKNYMCDSFYIELIQRSEQFVFMLHFMDYPCKYCQIGNVRNI